MHLTEWHRLSYMEAEWRLSTLMYLHRSRAPTLITVVSRVSRQAVTLSCHMMAAVRLSTGRAGRAALLTIHPSSAFWWTQIKEWVGPDVTQWSHCTSALTVLAGDSPVTGTTHARSVFPQASVTVGTMLETRLVTVATPQALWTRLTAAGTWTTRESDGEWTCRSLTTEGYITQWEIDIMR